LGVYTTAWAGPCDVHAKKAGSAKEGALVDAWAAFVKCDGKAAEAGFEPFLKASGDADTLAKLSLVAIDAKIYSPIWTMMEKIPDYDARYEVARTVGGACGDHPEVVTFLQGAYFGLRAPQFGYWTDALSTCSSDALDTWLVTTVEKPPATAFDDKYSALVTAAVKRKGPALLPSLEKAALAAASGGPFDSLLEQMARAIEPQEIGEKVRPEHKSAYEDAMVRVASSLDAQHARKVAERLTNSGSETAAAKLIPKIYSDKLQPDGSLIYGVAAVEICKKEAVIHVATVTEPAQRWSILAEVEPSARAFKPKTKCKGGDPWTVVTSGEPLANAAALATFASELSSQWSAKGLSVKTKDESALKLP